jgi:hypothetical protein
MSNQTLIPMRTVAVRRDVSTSAGQLELSERTPQNSSHTPLICSDVTPWVLQYRNSGNLLIHINPRMVFFVVLVVCLFRKLIRRDSRHFFHFSLSGGLEDFPSRTSRTSGPLPQGCAPIRRNSPQLLHAVPCGAIAIWSSTTSGAHLSSSFQEGAAGRREMNWTS